MSEVKKTKVHLISGFLGTGKTTALKSLMAQKDPNEKMGHHRQRIWRNRH